MITKWTFEPRAFLSVGNDEDLIDGLSGRVQMGYLYPYMPPCGVATTPICGVHSTPECGVLQHIPTLSDQLSDLRRVTNRIVNVDE